jgi:hypothetical protein
LAGRLKEAYSGVDARAFVGDATLGSADVPYRHTYTYDVWDNQRDRTGHYWGGDDAAPVDFDPAAGRTPGWVYDADGRLVSRNEEPPNEFEYEPVRFKYDTAGRRAVTTQTTSRQLSTPTHPVLTTAVTATDFYDGDGLGVKRAKVTQLNANAPATSAIYYLRSSVLGGRLITEYNALGARMSSFAYAGGEVLAVQQGVNTASPSLRWRHQNPVTGDARETDATGRVRAETHLDPTGEPGESGGTGEGMSQASVDARVAQLIPGWGNSGGVGCYVDYLEVPCGMAMSIYERGGAEEASGITVLVNKRPIYLDSPPAPNGYPQPGGGGGGDTTLAFVGMGVGMDYPRLPDETVTVKGSLDEPIKDPRMLIGGGFLTSQALFFLTPQGNSVLAYTGKGVQRLSECVKKLLAPYFPDLDLNKISLHPDGIPGYVPGDPDGYTEWNDIYFKKGQLNQNSANGIQLIAHELFHSNQYKKYGWIPTFVPNPLGNGMLTIPVPGFPKLYLEEAARVKKAGGDPGGYDNYYEKEAYDFDRKVRKNLDALKKTPCPP